MAANPPALYFNVFFLFWNISSHAIWYFYSSWPVFQLHKSIKIFKSQFTENPFIRNIVANRNPKPFTCKFRKHQPALIKTLNLDNLNAISSRSHHIQNNRENAISRNFTPSKTHSLKMTMVHKSHTRKCDNFPSHKISSHSLG